MSTLTFESLPGPLKDVRLRPLFAIRLNVRKLQVIGEAPGGYRRVGVVFGGVFEGERLSGEVLDGGSDWQILRPDRVLTLDVRVVLKTNDGAMIGMTYHGLRHGPSDVLQRIDRGETVDPSDYYFRIAPIFETAADNYAWLNRMLCIGVGHRLPDGPIYSVFEVL